MESNTEKGRRFQQLCRQVLEISLGRKFNMEIPITLPNGQSHRFDLATAEMDIVAECKAYTWTESGNPPAAKLGHLRESLYFLNSIPGSVVRHLIIKKSDFPGRNDTLGEYFIRQKTTVVGNTNVLELSENAKTLKGLVGDLNKVGAYQPPKPPKKPEPIDVDSLGRMRRALFEILDRAEGGYRRDEKVAQRVSRLRAEGKIPRNIANFMHTIIGLRNSAEYDAHLMTEAESTAARGAWVAILDWGRDQGWDLPILY